MKLTAITTAIVLGLSAAALAAPSAPAPPVDTVHDKHHGDVPVGHHNASGRAPTNGPNKRDLWVADLLERDSGTLQKRHNTVSQLVGKDLGPLEKRLHGCALCGGLGEEGPSPGIWPKCYCSYILTGECDECPGS